MHDLFFYLFAAITLLCGLMVVANPFTRNPVTSAMFLVATIIGMAGLFVLLQAFFLAAVQVLVYAGAVMVLFLFVIMLLDLKEEQARRFRLFGIIGSLIAVGPIALLTLKAIVSGPVAGGSAPPALEGSTKLLGRILFTDFILPFEILSLLLLVAMVGVILLSKKDLN